METDNEHHEGRKVSRPVPGVLLGILAALYATTAGGQNLDKTEEGQVAVGMCNARCLDKALQSAATTQGRAVQGCRGPNTCTT